MRRLQADRLRSDDGGGPRLLVARPDGQGLGRLPRRAAGQRDAAVHPLHQRIDRQAEGHQAHHGRLQPLRQEDDGLGVRHPRRRRLLVYGRHRLDHRAHVHRLRPADGRGDDLHVRRRAGHAAPRPLVGDDREVQDQHPLHRADGHPHLHQVGRRVGRQVRPFQSAPVGHGGRGDQPRGLDVVSPQDRRRALPDRRHLVADRDGRDHDDAAARRHSHQARQLHQAPARHRAGDRRRRPASRCPSERAAG